MKKPIASILLITSISIYGPALYALHMAIAHPADEAVVGHQHANGHHHHHGGHKHSHHHCHHHHGDTDHGDSDHGDSDHKEAPHGSTPSEPHDDCQLCESLASAGLISLNATVETAEDIFTVVEIVAESACPPPVLRPHQRGPPCSPA